MWHSWSRWRVLALCAAALCVAVPSGHAQGGGGIPPGVVGATGVTAPQPSDPVVAEVDGRQIHLSELDDEIRQLPGGAATPYQTMYPIALRRLIERRAMMVRAVEDGLAMDPTVKRHMREAADQVLEEAYLNRATGRLVTENMLLARYNAEVRGKPGPEEVHARAILVSTKAAARRVIAKLAAGADFSALARKFSIDPSSRSGGDLGFVTRNGVNPLLAAVLFALPAGQVTAYPVRTAAGWFVLQAVARRAAPTPTFAEARDRLKAESQRDQVGAVVRAALAGMTIRTYDMTGSVPGSGGG